MSDYIKLYMSFICLYVYMCLFYFKQVFRKSLLWYNNHLFFFLPL